MGVCASQGPLPVASENLGSRRADVHTPPPLPITAYPKHPRRKVTTETAINVELGLSVRLRQTVFLASPGENSNLHQILLHKSTVSGTPTTQEAAERKGDGWFWGELGGQQARWSEPRPLFL